MTNPTITAIIFSYNRPQMLAEAITSAREADEIILVDDGSDFDVVTFAKQFPIKNFSLIGAPQLTIEERLKTQRLPMLTNEALKQATGDIIMYLCDDDLFADEWIPEVRKFYKEHGEKYHMVRGHVIRFEHERRATMKTEPNMLMLFADSPRQLITGNFAHLRKCFTEEGVKWQDGVLVGHDTAFFDNMDPVHDTWMVPSLPTIACYRRIHDKMLTNHVFYKDDGKTVTTDEFSDSAKELLRRNQFLE